MKVLVSNTWAFEKEIARLNKRAHKVGFAPIAFVNLGEKTVTRTAVTVYEEGESVRSYPVSVTEYEVALPSVDEYRWTLAATITPLENGQSFVDAHVAGFDTARYQNVNPCRCEHCHTDRKRNLTYVVQNKDDGRQLQVGRSCFADYVGHEGLNKLEFVQYVVSVLGGGEDGDGFFPSAGGTKERVVSLRQVIAIAELLGEESGWKNNVKDEEGCIVEPGTHRTAAAYMNATIPDTNAGIWGRFKDTNDTVWAKVDGIIEQLRNLEPAADDDFAASLHYCAGFEFVPAKKAGLVAYSGQFLRNAARRAELEAKKATMQHVGAVGERMVFTALKCVRVTRFDGEFGITYFNNFEDASGNLILWKTGTFCGEEGKEYTMKATVKAHSEWKGGKQTEISRAKVQP